MEERYQELCRLTPNLYFYGSPVIIEAGALLKDTLNDNVLAQLKIRNLINKRLISCKVSVRAFENNGNELEGVDSYTYLDLNVPLGDFFGPKTPIYLPNNITRMISVAVIEVVFSDNTVWNSERIDWNPAPKPTQITEFINDQEIIKQYKIDTGKDFEFVPTIDNGLFLCSCGTINLSSEEKCYACNHRFTDLLESFDIEKLTEKKNERIRKEKEQQFIKEERKKQKRKRFKIAIIGVIGVLLLAGAIYGLWWHLIPMIRYNKAASKVENCEFDSAYNTYISLKDYRDCSDKAIETLYKKAEWLEKQEKFEDAIEEYSKISNYQDSGSRISNCKNELQYREAKSKYEAKDYDEAISLFTELGSYSDSKSWKNKSMYDKADDLFKSKDYLNASNLFEQLGDYNDSSDRKKECLYLAGDVAYLNKDYKTAFESYSALERDYKDAFDKAKESKYLYASECLLNENFKDASSLFKELDDYNDAKEKYYEATYAYAKECLENKDYENARFNFSYISGYEDSDKLLKEASYNVALKSMGEKDYKFAVFCFEEAKGYSDANKKINEAKYEYVKANKNRTDTTTYSYLKDLKDVNYSDAKTIYNDLYAWKVSVVTNTSESNETSNYTSISMSSTIYVHVKLTGGPPNESVKLKYSYKWPGSSTGSDSWDWAWKDGTSSWFSTWLESPWNGSTGNFTYSISTSDGTKLASGTIKITY